MTTLGEGLIVVAKRDCPTCTLIEPVYRQLASQGDDFVVYTQDDPTFPSGFEQIVDDTELAHSYALDIETVPTLIRMQGGREVARAVGWHRGEWEEVAGARNLGPEFPRASGPCPADRLGTEWRHGHMGGRNVDPIVRLCIRIAGHASGP